jgi:hypothetical protein
MNDVAAVVGQLIRIILSANHFSRIREKWLFDGAVILSTDHFSRIREKWLFDGAQTARPVNRLPISAPLHLAHARLTSNNG